MNDSIKDALRDVVNNCDKESRASSQMKISAYIYSIEQQLEELQKRIEELEAQRLDLWMLLDNIDTAEDIAKSDDKLFRGLCRHEYKKRWNIYEPKDSE